MEEIFVQSADISVYGYVIVIENHKKVGFRSPGIVHSLKRKTSGKRTVTYQGDRLVPEPELLGRLSKAEGGRD